MSVSCSVLNGCFLLSLPRSLQLQGSFFLVAPLAPNVYDEGLQMPKDINQAGRLLSKRPKGAEEKPKGVSPFVILVLRTSGDFLFLHYSRPFWDYFCFFWANPSYVRFFQVQGTPTAQKPGSCGWL